MDYSVPNYLGQFLKDPWAFLIGVICGSVGMFCTALFKKMGADYAIKLNHEEFVRQREEIASAITQAQQNIKAGFNESLERQKAVFREDLEFKKSNMRSRHIAYRRLWALLKPLRASGHGDLSDQERTSLIEDLTTWYHDKGGGRTLMIRTADAYIKLIKVLRAVPYNPKVGLKTATDLRTMMKYDLGVYSVEDVTKQVGSPAG